MYYGLCTKLCIAKYNKATAKQATAAAALPVYLLLKNGGKMNTILQLNMTVGSSVPANGIFMFDQTGTSIGNVSYNPLSGEITVSENGIYVFDWWVSTQSSSPVSVISLELISDKGDTAYANTANKTKSSSGIATVNISDAPAVFQLKNASGATVFFNSASTVKASLMVFAMTEAEPVSNGCLGVEQMTHVLEQVVTLYPGAEAIVFTGRLTSYNAPLTGLYKSPDATKIPMIILGDNELAIGVDKITAIYFGSVVYDDSITYLPPPDPAVYDCGYDIMWDYYSYVSVGDFITFYASPNTAGNGDITKNEFGIYTLTDESSMMFVATYQIDAITVTPATSGRIVRKISISNSENQQ